jgi:poly(3-hydroxybutyrate) depolymerase
VVGGLARAMAAAAFAATAIVLVGPAATAAAACDVTPTGGLVVRSPYLDDAADAQLPPLGDIPRTYQLFVPPDLPDGPVPLLVGMHGLGGNGVQHANQTAWPAFVTEVKAIAVFPSGPRRWDARPDSEDVAFLRDVVADVRASRCIDARRIYAEGHSYGAFMAQRLACDAGDVFAAVASYAGGDIEGSAVGGACDAGAVEPPAGYEPVAVGMWHGTADAVVAYADEIRSELRWVERYDCDTVAVAWAGEGAGLAAGRVHGQCGRPDLVGAASPLFFQALPAHNHGWPNGCGGGLGAGAGTDTCTPDGTFPSTADFDGRVWAFLSSFARATPAADDEIGPPSTGGTEGPEPDVHSGADSVAMASIEPPPPTVGAPLHLTPSASGTVHVGAHIDVRTIADPAGVGPSHPACPTASSGPSTQSAVGKHLTVSLGDGTPAGTSSIEAVSVADGTGSRVDADLPVPTGATGPIAVRVSYPGDEVATWSTCGIPRLFAKRTTDLAATATPVVPEWRGPAALLLGATVLLLGAAVRRRRRTVISDGAAQPRP